MTDYYRFDELAQMPKGDNEPTAYTCPLCEDSGVIVHPDGSLHPCRCWKQKRRARQLDRCGLAGALQRMRFENFDLSYYPANLLADENRHLSYLDCARRALDAALRFTRAAAEGRAKKGLMITGPVGSGKTHLAAAIANQLLQTGGQALFIVVPELLDRLRASYGEGIDIDEAKLLEQVQNAPVLVLDDLGAHNFSDWTKNKLFGILNYRLNHELPCVITTNLSLGSLQEIVGERIVSRLVAACDIYLLPIRKDIRLIKTK